MFNAAFLKLVEFLAGLAAEVFAINDKQAFIDLRIVFQQRRGLERGERLAAARGVPDIAVARVIFVFDDLLHGAARCEAQGFQLDLHHGHAVDQQGKFRIRQVYPVKRREFRAEILFQRRVIANIGAIGVFLGFQPGDQVFFYLLFCCHAFYPGRACGGRLCPSRAGHQSL